MSHLARNPISITVVTPFTFPSRLEPVLKGPPTTGGHARGVRGPKDRFVLSVNHIGILRFIYGNETAILFEMRPQRRELETETPARRCSSDCFGSLARKMPPSSPVMYFNVFSNHPRVAGLAQPAALSAYRWRSGQLRRSFRPAWLNGCMGSRRNDVTSAVLRVDLSLTSLHLCSATAASTDFAKLVAPAKGHGPESCPLWRQISSRQIPVQTQLVPTAPSGIEPQAAPRRDPWRCKDHCGPGAQSHPKTLGKTSAQLSGSLWLVSAI